jgi:hypothetical protein
MQAARRDANQHPAWRRNLQQLTCFCWPQTVRPVRWNGCAVSSLATAHLPSEKM